MRFLVDAQLPRRLAHRLRETGQDVVHTLDLPRGNRTTDAEINDAAAREQRVVVTKDADFVNSFVVARQPPTLLLISTGNITNVELEALVRTNLLGVVAAFETSCHGELGCTALVIHS